jgi:hypothetical protein
MREQHVSLLRSEGRPLIPLLVRKGAPHYYDAFVKVHNVSASYS